MSCSVHVRIYDVHARILNFFRKLTVDNRTCGRKHFAVRGYYILVGLYSDESYAETKTFVELISAYLREVVPSRVEEEVFKVLFHRVVRRNFTGAQTTI